MGKKAMKGTGNNKTRKQKMNFSTPIAVGEGRGCDPAISFP